MVRESRWCEQNDAATVVCSADGAVFLVVLSTCTLNWVAQVPAQDSSRVKTGFISLDSMAPLWREGERTAERADCARRSWVRM